MTEKPEVEQEDFDDLDAEEAPVAEEGPKKPVLKRGEHMGHVSGIPGVAFHQDGHYFDARGEHVREA